MSERPISDYSDDELVQMSGEARREQWDQVERLIAAIDRLTAVIEAKGRA